MEVPLFQKWMQCWHLLTDVLQSVFKITFPFISVLVKIIQAVLPNE